MTETRQKKIKIELFKEQETYTIYNGSMLDMLQVIEPNSIDAIVTDPPYELNFMNKGWDNTGIAFNPNTWKKCYEVLKPGGYLLAFGGSRTFHRIAVAIEDAGFEIRDTIMWIYGSGFPKSMNISKAIEAKEKYGNSGTRNKRKIEQDCDSEEFVVKQPNNGILGEIIETTRKEYIPSHDLAKQWQGWVTALKPAYEPVIVARKPFKGSLVDNIIENGVGGLNIEECRVKTEDNLNGGGYNTKGNSQKSKEDATSYYLKVLEKEFIQPEGRFPANVIHDGSEEVVSLFPHTKSGKMIPKHKRTTDQSPNGIYGKFDVNHPLSETYGDSGSAARFFYSAKADKKDRDEGLDIAGFEEIHPSNITGRKVGSAGAKNGGFAGMTETPRRNIHPTVKPCELMQYLVRLVAPKGATILDPFMGSGSTGKAVMFENRERNANYKFIGIDLEEKYCQIANARIDYALNKYEYDVIKEQQQSKQRGQTSIFDFIEVK